MSSPATLTVDHVRALVDRLLILSYVTLSGSEVLLHTCDMAEQAHAERQRLAVAENHDRTPARRMPDAVGFLGPLA